MTYGSLRFFAPGRAELPDPFDQCRTGNGPDIVEVRRARPCETLRFSERDLHGDVTDCGGYLYGCEFAQIVVSGVTAEQEDRAAAGRLGQVSPPQLILFQSLNSSQLDQSSASDSESG
jgi:hypothetical protein